MDIEPDGRYTCQMPKELSQNTNIHSVNQLNQNKQINRIKQTLTQSRIVHVKSRRIATYIDKWKYLFLTTCRLQIIANHQWLIARN